jgi:methylthioribulose-1-phosphate dehydratase
MSVAKIGEKEYQLRAAELIAAGRRLYDQGMVPATSGNLSARLSGGELAITVSGSHKGRLQEAQIMRVDAAGNSQDARRPSAETLLHVQIYRRFTSAGAVLHPHSVNATLLSRLHRGHLVLRDYELLKAFPGVDTHAFELVVPNFSNDQDIARLANEVDAYMNSHTPVHGYLIAGHGFYTWGETVEDALRHVEALEFLFECELRLRGGTTT